MTDSDNAGLSRKQLIAWMLAGMLIISGVGAIAETIQSGHGQIGQGGKFNASAGPVVTLGQTWNVSGGQLATDSSINVSTRDDGWVNVSSTGGGGAITIDTINDTWTNTSSISGTGTHNITLQPSNKNFTRVGGSITAFKFRDSKVDDDQSDAIYTGSGTIVFETNATDGTQYGLVDVDTQEAVGVGVADSNGVVAFTDVDSGTNREVRIEEMGSLTIREEISDHPKIKGCGAEATFFQTDDDDTPTILNKTDSDNDGKISFVGLPVDEQFAVQINCANYHNRTILLPDLSQQDTVYLLNKSDETVAVTFDIQDNTGDFSGSGTDFVVQRAINRSLFASGGFQWDNMAGDELGASASSRHVLNNGTRYRLEITSEEGETRILGAHVAETDGTVIVRISSVDITADEDTGYQANFTRTNVSGTEFVEFTYVDNENLTSSVDLTIHEFGNESNVLHDQTHTGTFGTLVVTEQLTGDDLNTTWVADWTATRNGSDVSGSLTTGRQQIPLNVNLSDAWKGRIALVSLIIIGFVVGGGLNPQLGAITVVAAAGLWFYIDWMPPGVTGAAITLATIVAVGYTVGTKEEVLPR